MADQQEAAQRRLAGALRLTTFEVDGLTLLRVTPHSCGVAEPVFSPLFPPVREAANVLTRRVAYRPDRALLPGPLKRAGLS